MNYDVNNFVDSFKYYGCDINANIIFFKKTVPGVRDTIKKPISCSMIKCRHLFITLVCVRYFRFMNLINTVISKSIVQEDCLIIYYK